VTPSDGAKRNPKTNALKEEKSEALLTASTLEGLTASNNPPVCGIRDLNFVPRLGVRRGGKGLGKEKKRKRKRGPTMSPLHPGRVLIKRHLTSSTIRNKQGISKFRGAKRRRLL